MTRAVLGLVVALLTVVDARASDDDAASITLDERVRVRVPGDMTHELRSLGPRGDMLTIAGAHGVVVVVVYRGGVGDKVPSVVDALATHGDELVRTLGATTLKNGKRRALGRSQPSLELSGTHGGVSREGWITAFEARGRTVVVSAVWVVGSSDAATVATILDGISLR